jgi:hypothetical protein
MATHVPVPLGQRVMVIGDLLLAPEPTPSSLALATDVARTLAQWQGPGTVIVCGNLFSRPANCDTLGPERVRDTLAAHGDFSAAIRLFAERPDCRMLVLPGWRDPEVSTDTATVAEIEALGMEVVGSVDLELVTAAGSRRVLVRPGHHPTSVPG